MEQSKISEELVTVLQLLEESELLRRWFLNLEPIPPARRLIAFSDMAGRMRADGEDEAFVSAVSSLARPEIYAAVLRTLNEAHPE